MVALQVAGGDIAQFQADAVIVNLFQGVKEPGGGTGAVDKALGGIIADELAAHGSFTGKLGETLVLHTHKKIPARYVIVVGLGKAEELGNKAIRRAAAAALRVCKRLKVKSAATLLHGAGIGGFDAKAAARLVAEGTLLGAYQFTARKSKGKKAENGDDAEQSDKLETLTIVEQDNAKVSVIEEGLRLGQAIAEHVNLARDWVNDSPNNVTPAFLAEQARASQGLECRILERADLERLGMGSFLLVAQGSVQPPYLIHLVYKPKGTPRKKVALVGKGITFDSGGLSLKPAKSMETMKMDMGGAAAVIATMRAIAALGDLDVEVHGFAPTCENMPSDRSSKPGDIAKAMNGKTIEVNNTDAEGRLILCDAMTYAQQEVKPDELVDIATLTGACVVALGKAAAGIMGNNQALIDSLRDSGESAGERYWQLPMYDDYKDALKSDVADLINAGSGGEAGTPAAAMFLKEFVNDGVKWAHLDIAGPAWLTKELPEVPKGGTGFGVRTFLYYLYNL
jgi:leucyl aminopeptidase